MWRLFWFCTKVQKGSWQPVQPGPLAAAAEAGKEQDPDQASASVAVSEAAETASASVTAAEAVPAGAEDQ